MKKKKTDPGISHRHIPRFYYAEPNLIFTLKQILP